MDEVKEALDLVEKEMGKKFADPNNTLLLSVRSGAAVSRHCLARLPPHLAGAPRSPWHSTAPQTCMPAFSHPSAPPPPAVHARHDGHCAQPGPQ
jgi:hypothetical protein